MARDLIFNAAALALLALAVAMAIEARDTGPSPADAAWESHRSSPCTVCAAPRHLSH